MNIFRRSFVRFTLVLLTAALPCAAAKNSSSPAANPGTVEISSPSDFGRVAVISDIHGMYGPLVSLLRAGNIINETGGWSAGKTLLIVTGDSLDKGDNIVDTLDLWIALSGQAAAYGGRVIHLLGNHEAEFLSDPKNSRKAKVFREELKKKDIPLKEYTRPGHARADFLLAMPAAAKVGKWLFCHAGLMPAMTWEGLSLKAGKALGAGNYSAPILLGGDSILEAKDWWDSPAGRQELEARLTAAGLYGVVFGHQPKALNVEGASAVTADRRIVKIDNGMPPEAGRHPGSLLVFPAPAEMEKAEPASMEIITQSGTAAPLLPR